MVFGIGWTAPLEQKIAGLEQRLNSVLEVAGVQRTNGFADVVSGFGDQVRDPLARLDFQGEGWLTRRMQEDLYQHNGVAAAIVDIPADDATRRAPQVWAGDVELEEVAEALSRIPVRDGVAGRRRGLRVAINRALKYARMTGGAALILGARDGRMPGEPLDGANLEAVDRLYVHHAHELHPLYYGPGGEVEVYQLAPDADGSGRGMHRTVHASRIFPFFGADLTPQRSSLRKGWGDPVLQRVLRDLRHSGFVEEQAARTVARNNVPYFKSENIAKQTSTTAGATALRRRLAIMVEAMSVLRLIPLDAKEDVGHLTASMGGLSDLLDRYPYRVCASARIPQTKLYGMSPGGMNATGASDIQLYHETVMGSLVELYVVPCWQWVAGLLLASASSPLAAEPAQWRVVPRPLAEQSEQDKAQTAKTQADTDKIYIDLGVRSREDIAKARGFVLPEMAPAGKEEKEGAGEGGDARLNALPPQQRLQALLQVGAVRLNAQTGDGSRMALVIPVPDVLGCQRPSLTPYDNSPPHITVCYLPAVVSPAQVERIIRPIVARHEIHHRATMGRLDHLLNDQGQLVVYQHVELTRFWCLDELREEIIKALEAHAIPVSHKHHWLAHFTLAYLDDPRQTWVGVPVTGSWHVGHLELWGGAQVVELPLGTSSAQDL